MKSLLMRLRASALRKRPKQSSKYNQLVQEVKHLEQLLGYEDKSTGDVSSFSSSSEEVFANPVKNEYDSA